MYYSDVEDNLEPSGIPSFNAVEPFLSERLIRIEQ